MSGSVALVTGAARRIGAIVAGSLAARGWGVVIHHHSSGAEAEALALAIRAAGGHAATVAADLADATACERLVEEATAKLGPLSALVNNAALFELDTAGRFEVAVWDRQLAVNLRAPAILARDFARLLPEGAGGAVVNIVDCDIAVPRPTFFSYGVSKAALAAMTGLQARALAPRIRVNAVAPGLVLRSGRQSEERFEQMHDDNLLRRGTRPEDVAAAVLTLLESPAITGQVLFVDGGERFGEDRFGAADGA